MKRKLLICRSIGWMFFQALIGKLLAEHRVELHMDMVREPVKRASLFRGVARVAKR